MSSGNRGTLGIVGIVQEVVTASGDTTQSLCQGLCVFADQESVWSLDRGQPAVRRDAPHAKSYRES